MTSIVYRIERALRQTTSFPPQQLVQKAEKPARVLKTLKKLIMRIIGTLLLTVLNIDFFSREWLGHPLTFSQGMTLESNGIYTTRSLRITFFLSAIYFYTLQTTLFSHTHQQTKFMINTIQQIAVMIKHDQLTENPML